MPTLSNKVLLAILIIAIIFTAVTMAAIFVPAVSAWFAGIFGPFGSGVIKGLQIPLQKALEAPAFTLLFYGIMAVAGLGFAYWVWHWDIGYKFGNSPSPASSSFTNTMNNEPQEPERAPQIVTSPAESQK